MSDEKFDLITINQEFLSKVEAGEVTLVVRMNVLGNYPNYEIYDVDADVPLDTIKAFAKYNLLKTFIKILYVFEKNHARFSKLGYDYSNN